MDRLTSHKRIVLAFEEGFRRAAEALAQLSCASVDARSVTLEQQRVSELNLESFATHDGRNPRYLITTEVFGSVYGKCYLYLSEIDFTYITRKIPEGNTGGVNYRHEFIKELDNILSASIITQLSNSLKRKMYGDVPVFVGKVTSKPEDIISDDFYEQADLLRIHTGCFSFSTVEGVCPEFIWVFSNDELLEDDKREVA